MSPELAFLVVVFGVIEAAVLILGITLKKQLSAPPGAWVIRFLAGVAGTVLLVMAITGPAPVEEVADRLFVGSPGDLNLGADEADVMARLLLVLAAVVFLLVPGSWMDVVAGTVVALAISGFATHYEDTRAILACTKKLGAPATTPDLSKPVSPRRECPRPTPTPETRSPKGAEIAIELPKAKVVAPLTAIESRRAVIRPVLEVRGDEGLLHTIAREYDIDLAADVPAKKLTANVVVHVDTGKAAEKLLADVTAAKTIYLTPR